MDEPAIESDGGLVPFPVASLAPVRLRLDIAYDGTDFAGWAAQANQRTVAGAIGDRWGRKGALVSGLVIFAMAAIVATMAKSPAVLIADSLGRAWRVGQTDQAIGVAGISPVRDARGTRDSHGHLAAATSTGGMTAKMPGRVGDTPVIGAGTWAAALAAGIDG